MSDIVEVLIDQDTTLIVDNPPLNVFVAGVQLVDTVETAAVLGPPGIQGIQGIQGLAATDVAQTWTQPQTYQPSLASAVPVTYKGAAGQTGNLSEWRNNAGALLASINSLGVLNLTLSPTGTGMASYSERIRSNHAISGGGTITVSGAGDLSWSARIIIISNGRGTHFSTSGYFDIGMPAAGTVITGVGGAANQTVVAAGIPMPDWSALYYILPIGAGNGSLNANFRIANYTADLEIPESWVLIAARNSDNATIYINPIKTVLRSGDSHDATKGTGRSNFVTLADNQTVAGLKTFTGTMSAAEIVAGGVYGGVRYSGAMLSVYTGSSGNPGIIVRGFAGQTADIQQWQTSTGSIMGKMSGTGIFTIANDAFNNDATPHSIGGYLDVLRAANGNAQFRLGSTVTSAGVTKIHMGPAAKDSVHNRQWTMYVGGGVFGGQAGAAAAEGGFGLQEDAVDRLVIARINNGGQFRFNHADLFVTRSQNESAGTYFFRDGAAAASGGNSYGIRFTDRIAAGSNHYLNLVAAGAERIRLDPNGNINLNGIVSPFDQVASTTPLQVRGAASQTADLTQWQNSSGSVLAKIDANGWITSGIGFNALGNGSGVATNADSTFSTTGTGRIGLVVRAFTGLGQTADLQQWQNGNGGVLSRLSSNGTLFVPTLVVGTPTVGAVNRIDFDNPGIGGVQEFRFLRSTDSAGMQVSEPTNDSILYRFYMSDNPDGGDFFSWYFNDWQGADWEPLRIGGMINQFIAPTNNFSGNVTLNPSPYFTGNAGKLNEITRVATGAMTMSVNVIGYTGTSNIYWTGIDGTPLAAPSGLTSAVAADAASTLAAATYYYVVTGTNATGETTISNQATQVVAAGERVNLSWTASSGTSVSSITYSVYRSTTLNSGWVRIANGLAAVTVSDAGLASSAIAAPTANTTKNTFRWGNSAVGSSIVATGVVITGAAQLLNSGVTVTFSATSGGNVNDSHQFRANAGGNFSAGAASVRSLTSSGNISTSGGSVLIENGKRVAGRWGQHETHGTFTDFNSPNMDFGSQYVQGTANGPGIVGGNSQYYNMNFSLGSEYPMHGANSYAMQFAFSRNNLTNPYPSIRFKEGGTWTAWTKIFAGYADTAGTATPNNDANIVHRSGNESVAGVKSFTSEIAANAAINVGGVAGGNETISFSRTSGQRAWQWYSPDDPNLYLRDLVNARMAISVLPGTTVGVTLQDYVTVVGANAGSETLVVRAAAAQTALLQNWQTSTGASVAEVGPSGIISTKNYIYAQRSAVGDLRMGEIAGGAGLYAPSQEMIFYTEANRPFSFRSGNVNKATIYQLNANVQEFRLFNAAGAAGDQANYTLKMRAGYSESEAVTIIGAFDRTLLRHQVGSPGNRLIVGEGVQGSINLRQANVWMDFGNSNSTLRVGPSGFAGAVTTVAGQENSRHQITFSSYRDIVQNLIGAKIVAVNSAAGGYAAGQIQTTDLSFFTSAGNYSATGISVETDSSVEYMRLTSSGALNILNGDREIRFDNKQAIVGNDTLLRINQGSAFSAGVWFGGSNVQMGVGANLVIGADGNGTTGNVVIAGGTGTSNNRRVVIDGGSGIIELRPVAASATNGVLQLGSAGTTTTGIARVGNSGINLHIDAAPNAGSIYLNWYGGSSGSGVMFGNGASAQVGRVDLVGNASFNGNLIVVGAVIGSAATTVPLKVGGFAGQTADLANFQNSAGTVLAKIDSNGWVTSYIGFNALGNGSGVATNADSTFSSTAIGRITLALRAFTGGGQTADIQQWQNSAGAVMSRIGPDGTLYVGTQAYGPGGATAANVVTTDTAQTITGIKTFTAGTSFEGGAVPLTLKAGPTADHVYMNLFARSASPTVRSGFFGYANGGTTMLTINNELAGGLTLTGGNVTVSSQLFEGPNRVFSAANLGNIMTTDTVQTIGGQKTLTSTLVAFKIDLANSGSDGNRWIATWTASDNNWRIGMGSSNADGGAVGAGFVRKYLTGHVQYITYANSPAQGFSVGPNTNGTAGQLSHLEVRGSDGLMFVRNNAEVAGGNPGPSFIVGQAPAQTSDIQQWKNSAGDILARVSNDGTIYKGTQVVGGNAADTEIMAIMGGF